MRNLLTLLRTIKYYRLIINYSTIKELELLEHYTHVNSAAHDAFFLLDCLRVTVLCYYAGNYVAC